MRFWIFLLSFFLGASSLSAADIPAETIYRDFGPSVVAIYASGGKSKGSIGAGSIIDGSGLVVTNAHVLTSQQSGRQYPNIMVFYKPERLTGDVKKDLDKPHKATILAISQDLDIAILKVDAVPADTNIICLSEPEDVHIGQEVVAIGHPEQGGFWSLTYGRISGEFSDFGGVRGKNMYQTDTSVNRGNSGGPLLDARGCLVGVNTSIARKGKGGLAITGVNFALKSEVVHEWSTSKGVAVAYQGKERPVPVRDGTAEVPDMEAATGTAQEGVSTGKKKKNVSPIPHSGDALINNEKQAVPLEKAEETAGKKPAPPERLETSGKKASETSEGMEEAGEEPFGTDESVEEFLEESGTGQAEPEKPARQETGKKKRFETPKRPYDYDELTKVEEELEDMMKDMRRKIWQ